MTTITFGRQPGGLFSGVKFTFAQWLQGVVTRQRRERDVRAAVRELNRLDDRVLTDMGIERANIEEAVRYGR